MKSNVNYICVHYVKEKKALEGQRTGKWMPLIDGDPITGEPYQCGVYCDNCGFRSTNEDRFCPNCGAKMDKEED